MTAGALVLFSGGQDSTTCLAWALERYARVETIGFDYRQRHRVELDQRPAIIASLRERFPAWSDRLGDDYQVDVGVLGAISDTALTRDVAIVMTRSGLPNSFVPGRNLLFLSLAGAVAYRRDIDVLVGGMCETDFSGYPDCRRQTIDAMQQALSLGLDRPLAVATPLMRVDKAKTWEMARQLGGDALVELIVEHTHTCYLGERGLRHDWGYGCGQCPACSLRRDGHARWISDRQRSAGRGE